jgi:hypothetical protein
MVLTAYLVLSPAIGLSCHRRPRNTFRKLDAGVEASTASRANVRDDRETPLCGRDGSDIGLIWVNCEAISFRKGGWTGQISLIRLKKLAATRMLRSMRMGRRRPAMRPGRLALARMAGNPATA